MEFLTFVGYFMASMVIYQLISFGGFYGYKYFTQKRLESKIKSGEIKMITMDDIVSELGKTQNKEEDGDGTWH
jgi:hypothetical protein